MAGSLFMLTKSVLTVDITSQGNDVGVVPKHRRVFQKALSLQHLMDASVASITPHGLQTASASSAGGGWLAQQGGAPPGSPSVSPRASAGQEATPGLNTCDSDRDTRGKATALLPGGASLIQ